MGTGSLCKQAFRTPESPSFLGLLSAANFMVAAVKVSCWCSTLLFFCCIAPCSANVATSCPDYRMRTCPTQIKFLADESALKRTHVQVLPCPVSPLSTNHLCTLY